MHEFRPDIRPPVQPRRGRASGFARALWGRCAGLFRRTGRSVEVPTLQWMSVVGRRLLTPAEFTARQEYFDRQIAKCRPRRAR